MNHERSNILPIHLIEPSIDSPSLFDCGMEFVVSSFVAKQNGQVSLDLEHNRENYENYSWRARNAVNSFNGNSNSVVVATLKVIKKVGGAKMDANPDWRLS